MSEWLLTKEEMAKAYFESENTSELPSVAIARAQLRKAATWLKGHAYRERWGTRYITISEITWFSLLAEAGLEEAEGE